MEAFIVTNPSALARAHSDMAAMSSRTAIATMRSDGDRARSSAVSSSAPAIDMSTITTSGWSVRTAAAASGRLPGVATMRSRPCELNAEAIPSRYSRTSLARTTQIGAGTESAESMGPS